MYRRRLRDAAGRLTFAPPFAQAKVAAEFWDKTPK
jgi:hypothetical protein